MTAEARMVKKDKSEADEKVTLSMKLQLYAPADVKRRVLDDLLVYRDAVRRAFSIATMAQAAGAKIETKTKKHRIAVDKETGEERQLDDKEKPEKGEKIKVVTAEYRHIVPDGKKSKRLLVELFDARNEKKGGKPYAWQNYELREYLAKELMPEFRTFVADAAIAAVNTKWMAKDPHLTKARNGYLVLNMARRLGMFNNIALPLRPQDGVKLEAHRVRLHWNHVLGPVEFKLGTLDPGNWGVWRAIVEGRYKFANIRLGGRGKDIMAYVSYHRPKDIVELDPDRAIAVSVLDDPERFLAAELQEGHSKLYDLLRKDSLNAQGLLDFLARNKAQHAKKTMALRGCGNRNGRRFRGEGNPVAHRRISAHGARLSQQRERVIRVWISGWSARLVSLAVRYRAGEVRVFDIPDKFFGHPFPWDQFKQMIKYKAEIHDIKVNFLTSAPADGAVESYEKEFRRRRKKRK